MAAAEIKAFDVAQSYLKILRLTLIFLQRYFDNFLGL